MSTLNGIRNLSIMLTPLYASGSRYNSFGTFEGWGSKETIHCFHGSLCLQEGDSSESFEVLSSMGLLIYEFYIIEVIP